MPKSLDLVLGIAAVMLLLSLVVTALTHYVVSLLNLRGRRLRNGLAALLARLDPRIGTLHAGPLATAILRDPLVCGIGGKLGSFLHRAQFTTLCLSLAADGEGRPYEALRQALRAQGVPDPAETLRRIACRALELEQAHTDMSELARCEMALTAVAAGPFVAKINASFDQTMDRISARFTSSVRLITVAVALGLASFDQIDCLELVNQLAMDGAVRSQVVKAGLEGRPVGKTANERAALQLELAPLPASWSEWRAEWTGGGVAHAGGILLTAMLLSLGAPFWYGLLSGAIRLRPPAAEVNPTSWPASSTRPPESDEWHPTPASRYSAGRQ